ncbi:inositol 2-dehydrogenase [Streptomyces spinoverrucosus]|uniref:inositol 2-dehydrogenase n=1 Tax=Streptomyces spinoverrucosus TaxID=284043 RepID=UPI0018C36D5E|nr:inositol 2-dehydrogenase [Streptomyces spinoverrucosus]MBG0855769.1 inositol 2-dehydrogenase [Streptomyces spinoverrucosus]
MRIALIGCGRIGRVHAESVALHPKAELVRACDAVESAAREVAERFGGLPGSDADAVLADPGVDAVVIASPTPTHVDLLTRAVETGKAVMCEKPIDLDLARVDDCRTWIGAAASRVMVGFNRRFDPSFRAVRERVAAGEIGRLEQLVIISRDPAPSPAEYLASSGGLFRDMTIHDLDMARFFLGEVVEVSAMGSNLVADYIADLGDIDGAMVTLRGADGALAHITNSRRCTYGYDQRLEAFGALGALGVDNLRPDGVRAYGARATEAAAPYLDFFLDRYTPAYRAELAHFIEAIDSGTEPTPGFEDGRAALVLADAAEQSLRTGRVVTVGGAR